MINWRSLTDAEKAARLKIVKRDATRAAKDLFYPKIVLEKIDNAKTPREVNSIMLDVRRYL